MPEVIDTFSFDKGVNTRKNPTVLADGELQECEGFAFSNDGYLSVMTPKVKVAHTAYGEIRNLHRHQNQIIMQEGGNIRYKWDLSHFCNQYIPPDEEYTDIGDIEPFRCRVLDYKAWTFLVNERANKVFSTNIGVYDWGIDNPLYPPAATGGTATTAGTALGDMTYLSGIAAAFDGNTKQGTTSCASKLVTNNGTGYVGKDWGAGVTKTITSFTVYGSSDMGFTGDSNNGGACSGIILKLQGSTDNFSASIVDLYTQTGISNYAGISISASYGIDTTTAYRYHRIYIEETTGSSTQHNLYISEFELDKDKPDGNYDLYYTWVVRFPNGEMYETAPSPSRTVSVVNQDINWSGLAKCNYSGTGVSITKRLYRYSPSLGESFLVDEIANADTTYTDSKADCVINSNTTMFTMDYAKPPAGIVDFELYLQRVFIIKDNMLYWSEPYDPFAFKTTSAIAVCPSGENLKAVAFWGETLYIASESSWYRLVGSDPDTWMIKKTFADMGVINPDTVKKSKFGLIGLWHDGIYLFDGSTSKSLVARKLEDELFTDTVNYDIDTTNACFAAIDNTRYYFYYSAAKTTTLDTCLVIDFGLYPEIRIYNDPFIATAHEYCFITGERFLARLV